jgi:anti-sigma B factor antagonist
MNGPWPNATDGKQESLPEFEIVECPVAWDGSMLALRGELDMRCVRRLREALDRLVGERTGGVIVDLSEVSFIDSLSIAAIVAARRRLGEERRMAIVATHSYVLLIFEAGGLDSVVPLFSDLADAEAHVRG